MRRHLRLMALLGAIAFAPRIALAWTDADHHTPSICWATGFSTTYAADRDGALRCTSSPCRAYCPMPLISGGRQLRAPSTIETATVNVFSDGVAPHPSAKICARRYDGGTAAVCTQVKTAPAAQGYHTLTFDMSDLNAIRTVRSPHLFNMFAFVSMNIEDRLVAFNAYWGPGTSVINDKWSPYTCMNSVQTSTEFSVRVPDDPDGTIYCGSQSPCLAHCPLSRLHTKPYQLAQVYVDALCTPGTPVEARVCARQYYSSLRQCTALKTITCASSYQSIPFTTADLAPIRSLPDSYSIYLTYRTPRFNYLVGYRATWDNP